MEAFSQDRGAGEEVVIVAEFLVDVNCDVGEVFTGEEATEVSEEEAEVLMKSLENFSLQEHDYSRAPAICKEPDLPKKPLPEDRESRVDMAFNRESGVDMAFDALMDLEENCDLAMFMRNQVQSVSQVKPVSQVQPASLEQVWAVLPDTHTRRPSFKQSTPSCRTNMKQLLGRQQCLDSERRQQEERATSTITMTNGSQPSLAIPVTKSSKEGRLTVLVPNQVYKIKSGLDNPTKYHVRESQRKKVAEYLSEVDSSLPLPSTRDILTVSQSQGPNPPPGAHSAPAPLSRPPDLGLSSNQATSPSEEGASEICDDFLTDLLTQQKEGSVWPEFGLNEGGKPGSASMFDFLLKEESLGEDDMRMFTKDRVKKDSHNIIERRRRYNINDRIAELGSLLPAQNEPEYSLVRDVRQNKGGILKATVDYIKLLRRDQGKRRVLEERCRRLEQTHRKALLTLQEYELRLASLGAPVEKEVWRPATRGEILGLGKKASGMGREASEMDREASDMDREALDMGREANYPQGESSCREGTGCLGQEMET